MSILGILTLLLTVSSLPRGYSQCLTANDDLSQARDVALSPILDFNLYLFQQLIPKTSKANFVFSPYSIWNALILAYFGAGGNTEKQFQQVLRLGDKAATLKKWRNLDFMYQMRPETSINNTFVVANRAYFDTTVALRHCLQDILHNELQIVDFTQPNNAAEIINTFVSTTTRGTIKTLVSPRDVNRVRMALTNAAYFKGSWSTQFDPRWTQKANFTNLDLEILPVEMMRQTGNILAAFDDTIKAEIVELPYVGKAISMYLLKPYDLGKANFDAMVDSITPAYFDNLITKMFPLFGELSVPKFSFKSSVKEEMLSQSLKKMGLVDAFSRSLANFTYFSLTERLSLDRSIHKAFIEVNEEGTEAGASTAFITTKSRGNFFTFDRPFIFFIRDKDTRTLLFMGAYKNPTDLSENEDIFSDNNFPTRERRSY